MGIREEVNAFVNSLVTSAFTPPILYRSEHVDCWSSGSVFQQALVKNHPEYCRRLRTTDHEIIATWVRFTEQIDTQAGEAEETHWLYNRVNEAIASWGAFAEHRLILLIRSVVGGVWSDEEVVESLRVLPSWWSESESERGS